MTGIKPSAHGIVVDHKGSGTRYAVSDRNYNEKIHHKVRDLRPGETVLGYQPKRRSELGESTQSPQGGTRTPGTPAKPESESSEAVTRTSEQATQTEGANPGTQEKEGK